MEPWVGTLTIERYRAFQKLEIQGLGRVNLITGRNNTGKSSVLEALRLLASDAAPSVLYDILYSREEDVGDGRETARPVDEGALPFSSLFHGFPQFSEELEPIVVESRAGERPMRLEMSAGEIPELRTLGVVVLPQGGRGSSGASPLLLPALVTEVRGMKRHVPLDYLRRARTDGSLASESCLPCVFVSPYGGERTATLGDLWDQVALSDLEKDVVEGLRIIDPAISAVSMVGGQGSRQARTAIVRASGLPRPVPLRSFGDGLNRLFGVILSLVNAKGGLLLIDEFENGLHHTVQTDAWRAVFRLARRLDVQVVATSHSWDAIEAFQKAASEDPEEGVLVRLSRKGEDIIPTLFREDELAVATRDRIEVR